MNATNIYHLFEGSFRTSYGIQSMFGKCVCKFALWAVQILQIFAVIKQRTMEKLQASFDAILRPITNLFHRYMFDRINWNNRMIT